MYKAQSGQVTNKNAPQRFQDRHAELGRPLLGTVLTIASPMVAMLAAQTFDWVMIDMEHAPMSAEQMTHMVHAVVAASKGNCLPIVRVPSHDVEWIKWALDSGAAGIIIPMVNNAAEMERIISHAIYPPRGKRSFGPFNAPFGRQLLATEFGKYYDIAQNNGVAILPIIESAEGLQNADAIMAVDSVAGVFVGPYDLRLSLGLKGGIDGLEDEFVNGLKTICSAGKKYGKIVGSMGVGSEIGTKRADGGMTFLLVTIDYNVLVGGFAAAKQEVEDALRKHDTKTHL